MLGCSLVYTDGKVLGYGKDIKLGLSDRKVLGTDLEMYIESHLGLMLEHIWAL